MKEKDRHGYDFYLNTKVGNDEVGRLTAEGKKRLMSLAQKESGCQDSIYQNSTSEEHCH